MKKIVVLTGAGISAESGLKTFRGAGGLWEGQRVQDVATPEAWHRNPEMVLRFYNERRAQARAVAPNAGHLALVRLETAFDVHIITQNVDDLHERAGSSQVMHLHGELNKARSVSDPDLIIHCEGDIALGDIAADGGQLRPHIVWFGEQVPMIEQAARITTDADIFIIVGTSLAVYPAAGLLDYVPHTSPVFLIDPQKPDTWFRRTVNFIEAPGSEGMPMLVDLLLRDEDIGQV